MCYIPTKYCFNYVSCWWTSQLTASERRIVDALSFKMDALEEKLLNKIAEKDIIIDKLNYDIVNLRATVSRLGEKIDNNDSYERRDTLLFSGKKLPKFDKNENCATILNKMLRDEMNYSLPNDSISVCHRLGPVPKRGEDRRTMIVKFCRRDTKMDVLKAAKTAKPQDESLTPSRRTIH